MSPPNPPPSRRLVKTLAAVADVHERTALRALVYGPDAIHGYALREKLRAAIATLPVAPPPEAKP
jgi:anaerobic glycerol-3-phosphate dehydrogenase